jgi:hypothetical protein
MAEKTLEDRVSTGEAQLGNEAPGGHVREQAELIDRLFVYRFDELDKKWAARFKPMERDLAAIKHAVKIILTRLT